MWPTDAVSLVAAQRSVAAARPEPWQPSADPLVAGCWVCFPRGLAGRGGAGDRAWSAAVAMRGGVALEEAVRRGVAGATYEPGLLALRIGPLLEDAAREVADAEVLMVDATSSDHPRGAGLALQLGAVTGLPTVGVTHRPLLASGDWPPDRTGATSLLTIGDEVVGCWLRTRAGTRPLAVHPGWRVGLDTAVGLVVEATGRRRTPEPLRRARELARTAREDDGSGASRDSEANG